MNPPNEVCARHYASGQPVRLRWQDGHILECNPAPDLEASLPDQWLAPALVDLQVNGDAGIDFQRDDLAEQNLLAASRGLAQDGCTRWLLTLITDDWGRLLARLRHLRCLREGSTELRHAIAGWHIEGPFLSSEPGFCGAHDASVMIDPTPQRLHELREATENDSLLLTLAPERPGALDAVRAAVSLGFVVSLGHTDASASRIAEAVQAGARAFTHLGNACPRTLDRHDNILWRVLDAEGLTISLIPDAIHVSPPLFRLVHRLIEPSRLFYVSDAMSAAGAPPGRYPLGRLELEVGPDQVVRLPGQPNFAGSALRPIDGVMRAARMLGGSWMEAWTKLSTTPARLMQLPGGLEAGSPADFCVIEFDPDGSVRTLRTWVQGQVQSR